MNARGASTDNDLSVIDEFGVGDADEFGEGDADGWTIGRGRSARGIGVTLGLGDADSIAAGVELGLGLERDLSTGDRWEVGLSV